MICPQCQRGQHADCSVLSTTGARYCDCPCAASTATSEQHFDLVDWHKDERGHWNATAMLRSEPKP